MLIEAYNAVAERFGRRDVEGLNLLQQNWKRCCGLTPQCNGQQQAGEDLHSCRTTPDISRGDQRQSCEEAAVECRGLSETKNTLALVPLYSFV